MPRRPQARPAEEYRGRLTVADLLADRAGRWPDTVGVLAPGGDLSYGRLHDRACRVAGGLQALGVRPGDRVATMLDATADYLAAWHGAAWAGAIETPLNTELRGTFLAHQLRDSGSQVLVCEGALVERLAGLELPALRHVVARGPAGPAPAGVALHDLASLLAHEPGRRVERGEGDPATILYTSGTTGPSKGVLLPNAATCRIAHGYVDALDLTCDDIGYSMFPLFHVMGRGAHVLTSLVVRCPVVLRRRFSVHGFWEDVRATGTTWFGYFGTVILFLWREPAGEQDRAHRVRVAFGASAPPELAAAWEERFGVRLVEVYGSTELGLASIARPDEVRRGTMGKPVGHLELAVHGPDGPVAAGTRGEIVARPREPHSILAGYWNRPEATVDAWRDLWFHTGDAGSLDADGYLTFRDRLKDSIRRRGENVSSFEVEEAVRGLPTVVECAAYPVPSRHGDDEVMVAVVLEPGEVLDPAAFFAALAPRMPRFAVPAYVRVVAELPKTPSQRVEKYRLREEGVTADTVDREALGIEVL